jgi:hypothetical protein
MEASKESILDATWETNDSKVKNSVSSIDYDISAR